MSTMTYTSYRISTITAVGNVNTIINLQKLFDLFTPMNNIVYMVLIITSIFDKIC